MAVILIFRSDIYIKVEWMTFSLKFEQNTSALNYE